MEKEVTAAFRGKVALVTGGAGGLGGRISRLLAAEGCRVAVHYGSSEETAREIVDEIRSGGGDGAAFQADLSEFDADELLREVTDTFGDGVSILVNNAAITRLIRWEDVNSASDDVWRQIVEVNLLAPVALVRCVLPFMLRQGWGRVLNVASTSAFEPTGSSMPYSVSKAALVSYSRNLAAIAPQGLSVTAIAPGWMATPWVERDAQDTSGVTSSKAAGEPEVDVDDVASLAVTLMRSSAANGSVVLLDSGAGLRHANQAP